MKEGRLPKIALCHGLAFPELPSQLLGLTTIEQRLVSPKHEFMDIRSMCREGQQGLQGMVVNVLIDSEKTDDQLPGTFWQSETIQLQLFWKMSFKKSYLYESIRPDVVLEGTRFLTTTELFKQEKIVVSD